LAETKIFSALLARNSRSGVLDVLRALLVQLLLHLLPELFLLLVGDERLAIPSVV
jgi:hypothetical protein